MTNSTYLPIPLTTSLHKTQHTTDTPQRFSDLSGAKLQPRNLLTKSTTYKEYHCRSKLSNAAVAVLSCKNNPSDTMQYSNNYYRSSSATKKIHPERTLPQKNTVHCTGDCRKRKRNIKKIRAIRKITPC